MKDLNLTMKKLSEKAVELAKSEYSLDLDYSEESLLNVESILQDLHLEYTNTQVSEANGHQTQDEDVDFISHVFGSYLSQVIAGAIGGVWVLGSDAFPGKDVPTFRIANRGDIWPQFKVGKRITNGPEDNIFLYYKYLKNEYSAKPVPDTCSESTNQTIAPSTSKYYHSEIPDPRIISLGDEPNYSTDYFVLLTDNSYIPMKPGWSWKAFFLGPFTVFPGGKLVFFALPLLIVSLILAAANSFSAGFSFFSITWISINVYAGIFQRGQNIRKYQADDKCEYVIVRDPSPFVAADLARIEIERRNFHMKNLV